MESDGRPALTVIILRRGEGVAGFKVAHTDDHRAVLVRDDSYQYEPEEIQAEMDAIHAEYVNSRIARYRRRRENRIDTDRES